jgi:hypothetical protein
MQDLEWRLKLEEREDGVVISTIEAPFMNWYGKYEIAISVDGSPWNVCFGSDYKEEIIKKHEEYAKMTKEELIKIYKDFEI